MRNSCALFKIFNQGVDYVVPFIFPLPLFLMEVGMKIGKYEIKVGLGIRKVKVEMEVKVVIKQIGNVN